MKSPVRITEQSIRKALNQIDEFYKARMQEGYKLQEVNSFTLDELEQLASIYEEKEQYIDEVFPWLF